VIATQNEYDCDLGRPLNDRAHQRDKVAQSCVDTYEDSDLDVNDVMWLNLTVEVADSFLRVV